MALPKFPAVSDKPRSLKDTIYTSTPVILTVIATILAGMSSSEMTRSQYFRALAAQEQAKASDQWGYYQAKRMRAVEAENSLDLLNISSHPAPLDVAALEEASGHLAQATATSQPDVSGDQSPLKTPDPFKKGSGVFNARIEALGERAQSFDLDLRTLLGGPEFADQFGMVDGQLIRVSDKPIEDQDIVQAMNDIEQHQTEAQMSVLLRKIKDADLDAAMQTADANLAAFDQAQVSRNKAQDELHKLLTSEAKVAHEYLRLSDPAHPSDVIQNAAREIDAAQATVVAARLQYSADRYNQEAQYNRVSGQLFEVQVRQSGVTSTRHQRRSANLFYGMLAAQAGVTIATLALAVQRRSIFWSLAAAAGTAAVGFGGYIYLFT